MRVGLIPDLNTDEKASVKRWLEACLRHARLSSRYPLGNGQIGIYVNGYCRQLWAGTWDTGSDPRVLYVGTDGTGPGVASLTDRLCILSAIISACDLWTELADLFSTALSRTLLESYNEMMGGLLATRGLRATGLAFNPSAQQVAARFVGEGGNESWHLPNGEQVDIAGDQWTVAQ